MNSEMTVTATNATTGGSAKGSLSTSAIRFTAGIGNHWTMDWGFEIGIDWLTASTLLSSSSSASVTESSGRKLLFYAEGASIHSVHVVLIIKVN